MSALDTHILRVIEEGDDCELWGVSCKIWLGFLKLSIKILCESKLVVVLIPKLPIFASFIRFCFFFWEATFVAHLRVVDFVAWFDYLYCNETVLYLRICNTLNVASPDFIKGHNLIVLTIIIFDKTINELLARLLCEFAFFKVTKEEEFFFLVWTQFGLA